MALTIFLAGRMKPPMFIIDSSDIAPSSPGSGGWVTTKPATLPSGPNTGPPHGVMPEPTSSGLGFCTTAAMLDEDTSGTRSNRSPMRLIV